MSADLKTMVDRSRPHVPPKEWKGTPKSERMLSVLEAVKTLPVATSPAVATHCGLTLSQAAYCLNVWGRFKCIKRVGKVSNGRQAIIVWGIA